MPPLGFDTGPQSLAGDSRTKTQALVPNPEYHSGKLIYG